METLVGLAEKFWTKLYSIPIVYAIIIGTCHSLCVMPSSPDLSFWDFWENWVLVILGVVAAIFYTIYCIMKRQLPRAPKKKIAVLFVIDTESTKSFKSVQYKLVKEFQEIVRTNIDSPDIVALCVPQKRVSKYTLSKPNDMIELLKKTNCVFLIDVKYLTDDDENAENFEMRINCGVVHPQLHETIDKALKRDLANLGRSFKQLNFAKESILPVFKFTVQALSYTCQYILGFVCLFCGSTNEALNIYEKLKTELIAEQPTYIVKLLRELVPIRLHTAYIDIAEVNVMAFQSTKELSYLQLARTALEEADRLISGSYAYNLELAYVAIALEQNYDLAKACIENCKKFKDKSNAIDTWKYSDAFLSAYKGHSASSIISKYQAAFDVPYPEPLNLTDYTEYVLGKEPERIGLHLAAGLLYEHIGDMRSMKNHFSLYIDHLGDGSPRVVATLKEKMAKQPCEFDCNNECQRCSGSDFG